MFLPLSMWAKKIGTPKFYGPSFHQQHDPAMHAKQLFTLHVSSSYCMVMVLMEK